MVLPEFSTSCKSQGPKYDKANPPVPLLTVTCIVGLAFVYDYILCLSQDNSLYPDIRIR